MAGISLSPSRALAYPGTRLTFVDESSVAYCFGSAVRITHLLPDKVLQIKDTNIINVPVHLLYRCWDLNDAPTVYGSDFSEGARCQETAHTLSRLIFPHASREPFEVEKCEKRGPNLRLRHCACGRCCDQDEVSAYASSVSRQYSMAYSDFRTRECLVVCETNLSVLSIPTRLPEACALF